MIFYIKLAVFTLITGILASVGVVGNFGTVPEYFLCITLSLALVDKDKMRAVVMSIIFAVMCSALTDRLLIYCIVIYSVPAVIITELFGKGFKRGLILMPVLTGVLTLLGETVFYYMFIRGNIIVDFTSVIIKEFVFNIFTGMIFYLVSYRIYNPRKRRFKITVE